MTKKNSQGSSTQDSRSLVDKLKDNDDDSLALFLSRMAKFDKLFCDSLASGDDFTIRLDIRGNRGRVIHCKVHMDEIAYPKKAGKFNGRNELED